MKKFIIALATVVVLSVPAFADSSFFTGSPFEFTNPYVSFSFSNVNSSEPVYYYLQYFPSSYDTVSVNIISEYLDASTSAFVTYSDNSTATRTYSTGNIFGDYFNNSVTSASSATFNPDISIFPSSASNSEIQQAFSDYLLNLPEPSTGNPVTVHVPYGNVLYIKVDHRQEDIQLVAHMPKLSFLIPDRNFGYWGESGICWGDYNTLPYSGLTFPLQGMSGIDWQRDSSRNILGQTKTGVATKIMNTGVWYALFCPSLFGHFDLDSSSALSGASVDVTGVFSDIRLYPLSDSYSFVDNEVINGSDSEYQDYFAGEPTESGTVTWTDQDGNVSAPRAGGSSYVPEAETAESLVSQIKNILGNIVKELQTLFTFGYDAIQTLVNLMSDFVSGFSQLYTWLPAPVYSVIISAVTIAIVIGVFKVFL